MSNANVLGGGGDKKLIGPKIVQVTMKESKDHKRSNEGGSR